MDYCLQQMIKSWKKADPPPDRVKPVPVTVLRCIHIIAFSEQDTVQHALADMITIAFFFLLRPGKYTSSTSETTPFTLHDVQFFIGDRRLKTATAPLVDIELAIFATLTFTTQKNGVRGEVVGLSCSQDSILCPVQELACRVIHLRLHNAPPTTPLATDFRQGTLHKILPSHISTALRMAVTHLGLVLGFTAADIFARCLRASGANALLCADVDGDIIRLLGR